MTDKLAIVGAGTSTRDNAPYADPGFEVWSFADWLTADWLKRCTAIIEVHGPHHYRNHPRTPEYWPALQTTSIPVYMCPVADPEVPSSIRYPLEEVLAMLPPATNVGERFSPFNCTLAYAMALGIHQGFDLIEVYGVELTPPGNQYARQTADFAFWVGFAAGRGIELNINCSEHMFAHPLYGVEDVTDYAKLHEYQQTLLKQRNEAQNMAITADGALQLINKLMGQ